MHERTFHLDASGVPVTWSIVSVYGSAYGTALKCAEHCADASSPQFVCEIRGDEVLRRGLIMDESFLLRQNPDDAAWLVQTGTAPFDLSAEEATVLTSALRDALKKFGYLIPRDEWRRRYPADALMSQRFTDFDQALKKHGRDMPFEMRWTPMMEVPAGFVFPWTVDHAGDGLHVIHELVDGRKVRRGEPGLRDDLLASVRLLNADFTPDEVELMLRPSPLSDADLAQLGR